MSSKVDVVCFVDCHLPWPFSLKGNNAVKVAKKDLKWNALPCPQGVKAHMPGFGYCVGEGICQQCHLS